MKVFISWSGDKSKTIAKALNWFLPRVISTIDPWISSEGIDPGVRWSANVASQLEETNFGIICLTNDNQHAPWIQFESGALSKYIEKAYVIPYLFDIKPTNIVGPLAQFQAMNASKLDTKKIIMKIYDISFKLDELRTSKEVISDTFERFWVDYEEKINTIQRSTTKKKIERKPEEMLEEILGLLRSITRESSNRTFNSFNMENAIASCLNRLLSRYSLLHGRLNNKMLPDEFLVKKMNISLNPDEFNPIFFSEIQLHNLEKEYIGYLESKHVKEKVNIN